MRELGTQPGSDRRVVVRWTTSYLPEKPFSSLCEYCGKNAKEMKVGRDGRRSFRNIVLVARSGFAS